MKLVVFHKKNSRDKRVGIARYGMFDARPPQKKDAQENHAYDVHLDEYGILTVEYSLKFFGEPIQQCLELPLMPWSYFSFWYRPGLGRTDIINERFNIDNAMFACLLHEMADEAGAIGRVLTTDDTACLYLRGNIDDIAGFENVLVAPRMHAPNAFGIYTNKARILLDAIQHQRDRAACYSVHERLRHLEAEVGVMATVLARHTGTFSEDDRNLLGVLETTSRTQGRD